MWPPATLPPIGPVPGADSDVVLVMTFCTREALVADSIQYVWQHIVELPLLINQFLVLKLFILLILRLKDMAQKLLLLNRYGVVPLEKVPSRSSSASTKTSR